MNYQLLAASSSKVVGEIFASKAGISADTPQSGKMTIKSLKKALHQVSVSSQFHESLVKLLAMLDSSQPHFIRCIKPNEQKAAKSYVGQFVLTQLRYGLQGKGRRQKLKTSIENTGTPASLKLCASVSLDIPYAMSLPNL